MIWRKASFAGPVFRRSRDKEEYKEERDKEEDKEEYKEEYREERDKEEDGIKTAAGARRASAFCAAYLGARPRGHGAGPRHFPWASSALPTPS